MCIEVTEDDFNTVHHELGHVFYQLAYRHQPFLFKDSANDAFHEAIGDTVALSITPEYLKRSASSTPSRRRAGIPGCCCDRRSTRSRSCRSGC